MGQGMKDFGVKGKCMVLVTSKKQKPKLGEWPKQLSTLRPMEQTRMKAVAI